MLLPITMRVLNMENILTYRSVKVRKSWRMTESTLMSDTIFAFPIFQISR